MTSFAHPGAVVFPAAVAASEMVHASGKELITAVVACTQSDGSAAPPPVDRRLGTIEYETSSKYSRIRVRKSGTVLSLNFVRDGGLEVIETQADLSAPHKLLLHRQFVLSKHRL